MSLKATIDADIKSAMLARDQVRLLALRDIKKLILMEETKAGGSGVLQPDEELRILQKAVKQRKDAAEIYRTQQREDLLVKEEAEIQVIEAYLPQPLSEEEIRSAIVALVAEVGATGPSDMGKVMGVATKSLAGKAEGKVISALVKAILSGN